MGSGIDPLVIGLSLLLLGVGAAAIVWARRKRGAAAMFLLLPLAFGLFLFGGASATPAQAAACPPPAACVPDPAYDSYVAPEQNWSSSGGDGGDVRYVELSQADVDAIFALPETGTATLIMYPLSDGEVEPIIVPLPEEAWTFVDDLGTWRLEIAAEMFPDDPFIWSYEMIYAVDVEDGCGGTVPVTWSIYAYGDDA